jgi:hypothetical protein
MCTKYAVLVGLVIKYSPYWQESESVRNTYVCVCVCVCVWERGKMQIELWPVLLLSADHSGRAV